ncbi:DUF2510 domain-containing protein [Rhodococcus sp. NPDC057135]|uniref:DUF2510 domain-containing protein n=1 Tax=Rhodococcus sp. NPDC057135 TaxID=3346028 RepID=UPI0036395993
MGGARNNQNSRCPSHSKRARLHSQNCGDGRRGQIERPDMTQPPGSGWFPDPEGVPNQLRWWDGRQWTSATQPVARPAVTQAQPEAFTTPATTSQFAGEFPGLGIADTPGNEPKKKSNKVVIGAIAAGILVIIIGIAAVNGGKDKDSETTASSAMTSEAKTTAPATTTKSAAEVAASAAAATSARAASEAAAEAKRQAEAAKLDPNTYESMSDRDFALFAKNPDAYKGRKLTLYGVVFQADAATGSRMFLARTAGSPQDASYDYDQNTVVTAVDPTLIADVVEDDFVTLHVEVLGSQSYDTQRGGSTTAPKVQVNIITVTGSK